MSQGEESSVHWVQRLVVFPFTGCVTLGVGRGGLYSLTQGEDSLGYWWFLSRWLPNIRNLLHGAVSRESQEQPAPQGANPGAPLPTKAQNGPGSIREEQTTGSRGIGDI